MVRYEIEAKRTALLVIDMTNDFVGPQAPYDVPAGREMIPRLTSLVKVCRANQVLVTFTTQSHRADGSDMGRVREFHPLTCEGAALRDGTAGTQLHPAFERRTEEPLIIKRRYSAFFNTDLDLILRSGGIDTLIVGGVATTMCCESTVRDAFFRDYRVIFLSDGNATHDLPDQGWGPLLAVDAQRHVMTIIAFGFGEVATVAEVGARIAAPGNVSRHGAKALHAHV
ncbi:MAG: cysteine hydrolase [Pseudonocardiales bacterium]|nr:MAG: cysteine hydrolase [Pseudonocardiales bacterium]